MAGLNIVIKAVLSKYILSLGEILLFVMLPVRTDAFNTAFLSLVKQLPGKASAISKNVHEKP